LALKAHSNSKIVKPFDHGPISIPACEVLSILLTLVASRPHQTDQIKMIYACL
jgi:hypothetical protein